MQVLIIEDDPSWALKLEMMVDEFGYQLVGVANSITRARELLQIQPIDLVLCDIMINDENAIEFFQGIPVPNYPIIFITNYADTTYYNQAKQLKKAQFLVKPFHTLTLKSIIESVVSETTTKETNKNLLVRGPYGQHITVPFETIHWINVQKNHCFLITQKKKYALKISMAKISKQLDDRFIQTHKGFCINVDFITRTNLSNDQIFVNNEAIPIGYKYRKALLDLLAKKLH